MRILAGFNTSEIGSLTFEGQATTGMGGYVSTAVAAGTYCAETMSAIAGASSYTDFATAVAAAMTTSMSSAVTGSFNSSTLAYTFSKTGASDWKIGADEGTASIARLGQLTGFSTSLTNTASITSDVMPHYVMETAIDAKSGASGVYEPDSVTTVAEADDGSSYSVSRVSAPEYEDWRFVFESLEATFTASATAAVPWTFQDFVKAVRSAHPFWVRNASEDTVYRMRSKGATFKPVRDSKDFQGHWHWPFMCRVVGRA